MDKRKIIFSQIAYNKFYFYVYYDPRNGLPFLVGKGHNKRAYDHLHESLKCTTNKFKLNKIKKLKRLKLKPIIKIFPCTTEDEAYACEEFLVSHWGRAGIETHGILVNRINGGRGGNKGEKFSIEHKNNISKALKTFYANNQHHIAGTKRTHHSDVMKEKYRSKDHPFLGMNFSGENNPRARNILIVDPNGKEFSIKGTFKNFCKENNLSMGTASKSLRTNTITLMGKNKGWKFQYA